MIILKTEIDQVISESALFSSSYLLDNILLTVVGQFQGYLAVTGDLAKLKMSLNFGR